MLDPLYTVVSFIMLRFHDLLTWVGMDSDAGVTWVLSIVLMVITIRAALFPLFVKQIKSQRRMQLIQPEMKALKEKHKGDRETLNREMTRLMQENKANPIMGCLPLLVQIPVFFSLFHVLRYVDQDAEPLYGWTEEELASASVAKFLGAPISASFMEPVETLEELGASQTNVRVVTGAFIIFMAVTMFLTMRQMLSRQKATGAESQAQNIQRLLMYVIPVSLMISGPFFPLGVLVYWTTTNLFSLGQQQYVIRGMDKQEEEKRQRAIEQKQNPKVQGPKPGAKPQRPSKGQQGAQGAEPAGKPQSKDQKSTAKQTGSSPAGSKQERQSKSQRSGSSGAKKQSGKSGKKVSSSQGGHGGSRKSGQGQKSQPDSRDGKGKNR